MSGISWALSLFGITCILVAICNELSAINHTLARIAAVAEEESDD